MSKKKSLKGKGYYATYMAQSIAEKNRIRKLKRHLKKHPEDTQATKAMKVQGTRRKASKVKGNFPKPKGIVLRNPAGHVIQ